MGFLVKNLYVEPILRYHNINPLQGKGLVAQEGLCGMEVVEVSPPYDHADITSLMALRIIVDALGAMTSHGTLKKCMNIFDKPFVPI